jgi:hypothetical protein
VRARHPARAKGHARNGLVNVLFIGEDQRTVTTVKPSADGRERQKSLPSHIIFPNKNNEKWQNGLDAFSSTTNPMDGFETPCSLKMMPLQSHSSRTVAKRRLLRETRADINFPVVCC